MALTQLDFHQAMVFNPLVPVFGAIFALWWALSVYQIATRRPVRVLDWANSHVGLLAIIGTVVIFVFGGIRILLLTLE